MTPGPAAFRPGSKRFSGSGGFDNRPQLDGGVVYRRAFFGPGNRLLLVTDLEQEIASELLAGVGVGTVDHLDLAFAPGDAPGPPRGVQALATDHDPGLAQRIHISLDVGADRC